MTKPDVVEDFDVFFDEYLYEGHPALKKDGNGLKKRALKVLANSPLPSRITAQTAIDHSGDLGTNPVRNTALFDRIADAIKFFPESYNQTDWAAAQDKSPMCGTAFCIAGHGVHETGWNVPRGSAVIIDEDGRNKSISMTAAYELGLTYLEQDYLFSGGWKPREDLTVPQALRKIGRGAPLPEVTHPTHWECSSALDTLNEQYATRGEIQCEGVQ